MLFMIMRAMEITTQPEKNRGTATASSRHYRERAGAERKQMATGESVDHAEHGKVFSLLIDSSLCPTVLYGRPDLQR